MQTFRVRSDCVVKRIERASRSFQSQTKTKNFLPFKKTAGGAGGSRKKLIGNFMVLFSPLHSFKKDLYLYLGQCQYSVRPFLRHLRRARRFLSAFCGSLRVRSHFAITSHRPFAFAHDAYSVLALCSLCGFGGVYSSDSNRRRRSSRVSPSYIQYIVPCT
jgi:hypothetical protein